MKKINSGMIIKCFPGYPKLEVGHILLVQNVIATLGIGVEQAWKILDGMVKANFLTYDEGSTSENRVAGWHLTEKGLSLLKRMTDLNDVL